MRATSIALVTLLLTGTMAFAAEGQAPAEPATTPQPDESQLSKTEPAVSDLARLTRSATDYFPTLRASRHAIEAAEARLDEATLSPFFQFQVTGTLAIAPEARGTPIYSPDDQLPLDNAWRPVVGVGVEGAVPLWTFGKLSAAREAASAGVRAARRGRDKTLAELLYNVRRAYYALQLALDVKQMLGEGQSKLQRAREVLDERVEAGDPDADPMDSYRLAAAVAELEARASQAKLLEETSRGALVILTGQKSVRIPECPIEPLEVQLLPVERYVARARSMRPELDMLRAAMAARQANLDAQSARYFPDLALALRAETSYGPGITNQTNPFIIDRANYTSLGAAVVARWSLDLLGTYYRVDRAEAELAETEAQHLAVTRGVELEVYRVYNELEDAQRREESWGTAERATRSWFIAAVQAYQVGTMRPRELVDAAKAYFSARFEHLDAVRALNEKLARLALVTGIENLTGGKWEVECRD